MAKIRPVEVMFIPVEGGLALVGISRTRRGTKARIGRRVVQLAGLTKNERLEKLENEINSLLGRPVLRGL